MKAIYDSAYHHPLAAYVAGLFLLLALVRRLPFLYGYLVFFLVSILADATVTGAWSPVPPGTTAYTVFSVLFIVLGDLRYFLLVERVAHPDASFARVLALSTGVSLILPISTGILTRLSHAVGSNDRILYAIYEGTMVLVVAVFFRARVRHASIDTATRRWLASVSRLFAGLYFGWALSDVLILAGVEVGHLLRIAPNVLYYAAFLPFVFVAAPGPFQALARRERGTRAASAVSLV